MDLNVAKQRLLEERERLTTAANGLADELDLDESQQASTSELTTYDQHPADAASETSEREKETAILETLKVRGAEIAAALKRIEQDSYGDCEECGKPIGEERLEFFPTARFCIEHQSLQERS